MKKMLCSAEGAFSPTSFCSLDILFYQWRLCTWMRQMIFNITTQLEVTFACLLFSWKPGLAFSGMSEMPEIGLNFTNPVTKAKGQNAILSPYCLPSALQFARCISGYIWLLDFIISSTWFLSQSDCMCSSSEKWMNIHIWEQKASGIQ